MTLSVVSVWRVLWLVFSHCHSCHWTHSFLLLRDVGWNYIHLCSISSWHFCFLFLGRCSICAQNTPVIVRRCDITVTSPLISVSLSRVYVCFTALALFDKGLFDIFFTPSQWNIFTFFLCIFWLKFHIVRFVYSYHYSDCWSLNLFLRAF